MINLHFFSQKVASVNDAGEPFVLVPLDEFASFLGAGGAKQQAFLPARSGGGVLRERRGGLEAFEETGGQTGAGWARAIDNLRRPRQKPNKNNNCKTLIKKFLTFGNRFQRIGENMALNMKNIKN
jgi:hypothetical protein